MKVKNSIAAGIAIIALSATTSCMSEKTLYSWGNYENVSYNYSKDPGEKNETELVKCYDRLFEDQKGTRKLVPPGMCAERAYLYIKKGKKDEAIALLNKEIKLYPESKLFIDRIIKQIEK